jgi:hypothetical protein
MENHFGEKVRSVLTILIYLLVHVRMAAGGGGIDISATLWQLLDTAPFVASLTVALALLLKTLAGSDRWPPWDRLVRIYCTIGICWGFFTALYEHAVRGQQLAG